jgi:hypothetical protein
MPANHYAMKNLTNISAFLIIALFAISISCEKSAGEKPLATDIPSEQEIDSANIKTLISTDIVKLEKLLNFKIFRPKAVKFKYILYDNSGRPVPGPSDSYLQAILYFDDQTFQKIRDHDKTADFPLPEFSKEQFQFDWLDKTTSVELENSDKAKSARPDFFFSSNGKCWYLDNKILLRCN